MDTPQHERDHPRDRPTPRAPSCSGHEEAGQGREGETHSQAHAEGHGGSCTGIHEPPQHGSRQTLQANHEGEQERRSRFDSRPDEEHRCEDESDGSSQQELAPLLHSTTPAAPDGNPTG